METCQYHDGGEIIPKSMYVVTTFQYHFDDISLGFAAIQGYIQYFKSEGNEKRSYSFIKFIVELCKTFPAV
jgi:hypothetical protein